MIRGEIYWADLKPRSGSEQRGRRPVLIVSHDGFNRIPSWRSIIVVPLSTSEKQAKRGPTAIAAKFHPTGTTRFQMLGTMRFHESGTTRFHTSGTT